MKLRSKLMRAFRPFACGAVALAVAGALAPQAQAQGKHYKVYLDLSYSGNIWQTAAANGIKALAHTPPYDKEVDFKTVISGTDVQRQISDIQSMIAAGADAILVYPLSPTAINRVLHQACEKHVLVFIYDSTVTEPCAYNVSNITARYGANSIQWIINEMGGKGEIVLNKGVAGTTNTVVYDKQAYHVLKRYPKVKIAAEFYGNWNDAISQEAVAKVLAAHPNIDAIWCTDGSYGSLEAVMKHRPNRLVVISGQSNNGFRLLAGDPAMQKKGLKALSSSAGPAVGPYAFKVMMEVLTGKKKLTGHNVEYPLPWVPYQDVKMCTGEKFENGCNVFPAGKVPPLFIDTALDPKLVPELDLKAVETGQPMTGETIQELPPIKYAENLPGVNCQHCTAPKDWLDPNMVKPIPPPK